MPKGKGNPPPDTTIDHLYDLMYCSVVVGVSVEFLQTGPAANPSRRRRGKKKNHVALRFIIRNSFTYWKDGVQRTCGSVRASIEPDNEDTWLCLGIDLKPMPNTQQASTSASAAFDFKHVEGRTIAEFVRVASANKLLPFEYVTVARQVKHRQYNTRGSKQPPETVSEHVNGCRDFTTQWWILLYENGAVGWNTISSNIHSSDLPPGTPFHNLIGFRYSKKNNILRIHQSKIAKAIFRDGHARIGQLMVGTDLVILPYTDEVEAEIDYFSDDGGGGDDDDIEEYQDKPDENWYWGNPQGPPPSSGAPGPGNRQIAGYNVSIAQH